MGSDSRAYRRVSRAPSGNLYGYVLGKKSSQGADEIFSWENIIGFSAPKVAEPIIEHYGWKIAKKFLPPVELAHMGELSYKLWLISDEGMNEKHDLDVLFKTLLYQCDH